MVQAAPIAASTPQLLVWPNCFGLFPPNLMDVTGRTTPPVLLTSTSTEALAVFRLTFPKLIVVGDTL